MTTGTTQGLEEAGQAKRNIWGQPRPSAEEEEPQKIRQKKDPKKRKLKDIKTAQSELKHTNKMFENPKKAKSISQGAWLKKRLYLQVVLWVKKQKGKQAGMT